MLALRMAERDEEALRTMLRLYGGEVRAALRRKYRGILADPETDQAVLDGMVTMRQDAVAKVDLGITTMAELIRSVYLQS